MKFRHLALPLALALTAASAVQAQDKPVEVQAVDALQKVYGVHPGFRPNHAKGIVTEGSFKASAQAAALSKAALFAGTAIPVTVRFSDAGGVPNIPDGSDIANPHGMAIKYHLPDGSDADMVLVSLKFFPVATGADFRDLLLAIAASPPDAPKPTKLDQFIAAHPSVPAAASTAATPESFATEEYYGINAFIFVNQAGEKQAVRYQMLPERTVHLDPADAAKRSPDFLIDDLGVRLGRGKVTFRLRAQLAAAGDQTADPSKPWPADRRVVDLGELTIDKVVPNSLEAQKSLLFMPVQVPDGIELSDDRMPEFRSNAYADSFARRSQ
jgi:catalase